MLAVHRSAVAITPVYAEIRRFQDSMTFSNICAADFCTAGGYAQLYKYMHPLGTGRAHRQSIHLDKGQAAASVDNAADGLTLAGSYRVDEAFHSRNCNNPARRPTAAPFK